MSLLPLEKDPPGSVVWVMSHETAFRLYIAQYPEHWIARGAFADYLQDRGYAFWEYWSWTYFARQAPWKVEGRFFNPLFAYEDEMFDTLRACELNYEFRFAQKSEEDRRKLWELVPVEIDLGAPLTHDLVRLGGLSRKRFL